MNTNRKTKFARAIAVAVALSVAVATGTVANAATKTISCYKGTAVKRVSGTNPKCAVGWTTKKPLSNARIVAFSGTYKGDIAMLWSSSDVKATSVTGVGTGKIVGLAKLTGTGSATPSNQCDGFKGSGVLSGGGSTLKVSFDSSARACGDASAAPSAVTMTGNAVITGGTGKFAGATGKLKVTGSFSVKSTDAGTSEKSALTLTLSGNINTK